MKEELRYFDVGHLQVLSMQINPFISSHNIEELQ